MRQSTLVCLAVVWLSLGLGAGFPASAAAQLNEHDAMALRPLSRNVQIDVTTEASAAATAASLRKFSLALRPSRITLEGTGDPALGLPVDCNMPVLEGDPSIDPKIVQRIREDGTTHTMRLIIVPRCAQPR